MHSDAKLGNSWALEVLLQSSKRVQPVADELACSCAALICDGSKSSLEVSIDDCVGCVVVTRRCG